MSTWEGQPLITLNGTIPLDQHLKKQEEDDALEKDIAVRKDIMEAGFGGVREVKGCIYHKPRPQNPLTKAMIKRLSSKVKEYTMSEQMTLLLEQAGEKSLADRFNSTPAMKKRQLERLLGFNKQLNKPIFMLADTVREFKGNGSGDPSRDLMLLQQAGVLRRKEKDNGQVEYSKITTSEQQVAVALVKNANKLVGYIPPSRKLPVPPIQSPARRQVAETSIKRPIHPVYQGDYAGMFVGMDQAFAEFKKIFPHTGLERFTEIFVEDRMKGVSA